LLAGSRDSNPDGVSWAHGSERRIASPPGTPILRRAHNTRILGNQARIACGHDHLVRLKNVSPRYPRS
jgi:hypothetical protein